MRFLALTLLALAGFPALAADVDLSGYSSPVPVKAPVIVNPSFDQGSTGWKMTSESRVAGGVGSNMSHGLVIRRTDPNKYELVRQSVKGVIPGARYNISAMIRTENVTPGKLNRGATLCITHDDVNGKYLTGTGSFPYGVSGTKGWTKVEIKDHLVSPKAGFTEIALYMDINSTGTAYFDDITMTPVETPWNIYAVNAPQGIFPVGEPLLVRIADGIGRNAGDKLEVRGAIDGKGQVVKLSRNGYAEFTLPADLRGKKDFSITVFDRTKKQILAKKILPLNIGAPTPEVTFDDRLRTIVNGKKFMPVGTYIYINDNRHLQKVRELGFNTVMPYNSPRMRVDSRTGYDGIKAALDRCQELGLKLIFNLKDLRPWAKDPALQHGLYGERNLDRIVMNLVKHVKGHPALLAYYTADEVSVQYNTALEQLKTQLNSEDPNHPVWQVHAPGYNTDNLVVFGSSVDVMGFDYYPFSSPAKAKLDNMEAKMQLAADTGMPLWLVPQMFKWKRFDASATDSEFPNLGEYCAQILVGAGCGAKGFVFYTYTPSYTESGRMLPEYDGNEKDVFPIIKAGNDLLHELEPYIMSDVEPEKLDVNTLAGKVEAWKFTDDQDNVKIAVVSMLPGSNEAEFELDGKGQAKFGNAKEQNGKWRFSVRNINCEVITIPAGSR